MADKQGIDLEKLIVAKIEELQIECNGIRKDTSDVDELQLLEKAEGNCKMCLQVLESGQSSTNKEMRIKILRQYPQALLDATYVVECRLVNEDFPQERSTKEIKYLIGRLDQPEQLVKEMFGSETQPVEILGTDLLECLCWRRGALFYMYCHTVFNDPDRRLLNILQLMECVISGVKYLESMLGVRSPVMLDEHKNVRVMDGGMAHLLKEGVYSDTHLLALMYAGEMCYWHWQLQKDGQTGLCGDQNRVRDFDSLSKGTKFLQKFVDVAKGSFQGNGWDCFRAEQILAEFRGP